MNETFPIKQTKFSNGEIDPKLYGEVTHPKYPASLQLCQNWLPIPQGALVKRPGLQFIAPVKDASYTPRLIKFFFSDSLTFVLEFGNLYVRFYRTGKYVGNDGNLHTYGDAYGGGYYELVTPFTTAMLPYLKYAQVGDVVTICYGGQATGVAALAPRDLSHTGGANTPWTLGFTPLVYPISSKPAVPVLNIAAWSAVATYQQGDFATANNVLWVSIQSNNLNNATPVVALNASGTALQGSLWWMPAVDLAHQASSTNWVQTIVVQDPNGVVFESRPSPALTVIVPLALDRIMPILGGIITPVLPAGWSLLFSRWYRSRGGGAYGWVADSTGTLLDDGRAADYTRQPPASTDPFLVNAVDSYPSVVGYLDQRRLWAASALLPAMVFLSKVGDLYNYDNKNTPGADTDAMNILLASEVLEQVRSFIPMRRGLILTAQGEWAVAGAGGAPVSRSNVDPKRQSAWGSSWLNPIKIGTGVLFNTAKSNMVRDLYPLYGLYSDIWDGQDLSVMARHLLDLNTVKDWDFQSTPYPVVWTVRDDGVALSLTYQHAPPSFGQQLAEGIVAWARHTTGVGSDAFEAVAVVPEPPEDAAYFVVKRLVNGVTVRNIERMSSPICSPSPYLAGVSDVRYGKYLDSWVTYDGHFNTTLLMVDSVASPGSVDPTNYEVGDLITVTLDTGAGPFSAEDAAAPYGSGIVLDPENLLGLGVVKMRIVAFTNSKTVTCELDTSMTQAQVTAWNALAGQFKWGLAKGKITAAHLVGYQQDSNDANLARGVTCLADGDVQPPAAWAAGVASLATPAVVIHIGISYNSDVALLDAWHPSVEIRNKFKNVIRIGFEVAGTRDMWMGLDFTNLVQWQQRQVLDAYGVMKPQTGYSEEFVTGDYNKSGAGVLRHYQPLPAALSAVLREVRLGDT